MCRYIEQLESQGGNTKFLFPSFKADLQGKKEMRLWKLDEAISYDNARKALLNAVKCAKIKIKVQNGPFGLHGFPSCRADLQAEKEGRLWRVSEAIP